MSLYNRQYQEKNKSQDFKIQLPANSLSYQDNIFYGKDLIVSRADIGVPLFSKSLYEETIENIASLVGKPKLEKFLSKEGFYSKSILLDFIEKEYNTLSHDQLIKVREKSNLKYYFIKSERKDLKNALVCIGEIFYIYDLTLIKKVVK